MREQQRRAFVEGRDYGGWHIEPFVADASFRRYFRLRKDSESLLLMDAQPPEEDVARFLLLAEHLLACGVRAPKIYEADSDLGFLIIEDFGDSTFTALLNQREDPYPLYAAAIDALVQLHQCQNATMVAVEKYDEQTVIEEASLFVDWFYPAVSDHLLDRESRVEFCDIWKKTWRAFPATKDTLVLRDYHVDNIMRIGHGNSVVHCGILDFQDALIGPQSFDVMSLLEDARRDVPADLSEQLLSRYKKAMGNQLDAGFDASYQVMAAHRHIRVLGVFVRLWKRDGKPVYLGHLPRLARLLESHRGFPLLSPFYDWLDAHIPDVIEAANSLSQTERPVRQ